MTDLTGKTAFITGASKGIGAAAARELSEKGVKVFLFARSGDQLQQLVNSIEEHGGEARHAAGDVGNLQDIKSAIEACIAEFGSLDILVNNAGLIDPIARLEESDPEEWSNVVDVNTKGVYYGMRFAIPQMKKQGGGTIINISSGAAHGALEGWSHYCSTKAAVYSLTRCGHKEVGPDGIHVVGLSPGTVATQMQVQIKDSGINPVSQLDPSVHIPASWVGKAIAWLAAEGAAEHAGTDFSLKTPEGLAAVGLPAV